MNRILKCQRKTSFSPISTRHWEMNCKLSWSKHIGSMVVKMGRGLSVIKRCSAFLTPHSTKQVLQSVVLSYLNYCPVMWSSVAKKDLVKLQMAQKIVARLALHCNQRANINTIHASLYQLRVEDRLTASLYNINVLKIPNCLHSQLTHSSDTHIQPTRHATRGIFTVPRKRTVLYRAMSASNSHHIQRQLTSSLVSKNKLCKT